MLLMPKHWCRLRGGRLRGDWECREQAMRKQILLRAGILHVLETACPPTSSHRPQGPQRRDDEVGGLRHALISEFNASAKAH